LGGREERGKEEGKGISEIGGKDRVKEGEGGKKNFPIAHRRKTGGRRKRGERGKERWQ